MGARRQSADGERTAASLAEVALHADLGAHPDAVAHLRAAGESASREFLNEEAVRFLGAAAQRSQGDVRAAILETLGDVEVQRSRYHDAALRFQEAGELTDDQERRVIAAVRQARAIDRVGDRARADTVLRTKCPAWGSRTRAMGIWLAARAWFHLRDLAMGPAEEDAREALAILVTSNGSPEEIADCWNTIAGAALIRGAPQEAAVSFERGIAAAEAAPIGHQYLRLSVNLAACQFELGLLGPALEGADRTFQLARRIGSRYNEAYALHMRGMFLWGLGRFEEADEALVAAVPIFQELGAAPQAADALAMRAICRSSRGAVAPAVADGREAVRIGTGSAPYTVAYTHQGLAEALLRAGDAVEASRHAREAADIFQRTETRNSEGIAVALLGAALAATGDRPRSDEAFDRATGPLFSRLNPLDRGRVLRLCGQALLRWGDRAAAAVRLREGQRILAAIGAAGELLIVEELLADAERTENDPPTPA